MAVGLVELVQVPGLLAFQVRHLLAVVVDDVPHNQHEGGVLAFFQELLHGDAHRVLRAGVLDPADVAQDEEADPVAWVIDAQMGRLHRRWRVRLGQRFGMGWRMMALPLFVNGPACETETTLHVPPL